MRIKNAAVYQENGCFMDEPVFIKGELFSEHVQSDHEEYDGSGCYAIPGLVDIHLHGCNGVDFCDGTVESIRTITKYQAGVGVTSIVPTTMAFPEDKLTGICGIAAEYRRSENLREGFSELAGINIEGPFISTEKRGAQNPVYIQKPDYSMFLRLQEAAEGCIKLCDIAPEIDGAMDFIEKASKHCTISLAHTTANYETAWRAFEQGASHMTHLYNAMPQFSHRAPGPIGAAADCDKVTVELICDGIHIHPSVVRTTLKMFGANRVIFISDSMMATGLENGEYSLGGQPVSVCGHCATLKDGTFAGSVTNLMDCMRNAVLTMGIPLETAVRCAAVNPAKCVGIYDYTASITPGKSANLVLLDKSDLTVRAVWVRGKKIK